MRNNGLSVTFVLAAGIALGFTACNRSPGTPSAQRAAGISVQPATQEARPSAPSQANVIPVSSSSPTATATSVPAAVPEADDPVKIVAADSSQTFTIAEHAFRLLKHVQRIERVPGTTAEETVEWWELRNSKDQVVHREQYPSSIVDGAFDVTVSVTASSFATKEGAGIVGQRGEEPSDPLSGGSVQVFGYKYGRDQYGVDESLFGSFGPPIWVEGDYLGIDTDASRPKPTLPPGVTMTTMDDILKFKVWTGNFFVMYPVRINWITG